MLLHFAPFALWVSSLWKRLMDEVRKPLRNPFDDGPDAFVG